MVYETAPRPVQNPSGESRDATASPSGPTSVPAASRYRAAAATRASGPGSPSGGSSATAKPSTSPTARRRTEHGQPELAREDVDQFVPERIVEPGREQVHLRAREPHRGHARQPRPRQRRLRLRVRVEVRRDPLRHVDAERFAEHVVAVGVRVGDHAEFAGRKGGRVVVNVEPLGREMAAEPFAQEPARRVEPEPRREEVRRPDEHDDGEQRPGFATGRVDVWGCGRVDVWMGRRVLSPLQPLHPFPPLRSSPQQHEHRRPEQRQSTEPEQPRPNGQFFVVDRAEDAAPDVVVRVELRVQPEVVEHRHDGDGEPDRHERRPPPRHLHGVERERERHGERHARHREDGEEEQPLPVAAVRPPQQRQREERPRHDEQRLHPTQHRPQPDATPEQRERPQPRREEPDPRHDRARLGVEQAEQRDRPQREAQRSVHTGNGNRGPRHASLVMDRPASPTATGSRCRSRAPL